MVSSVGTNINDFLGFFGVKGAGVGAVVDGLSDNQLGVLQNMSDMWAETAFGPTGPLDRRMMELMSGGILPFLAMASPKDAYPQMAVLASSGYAGSAAGLAIMQAHMGGMTALAGNPAAYLAAMSGATTQSHGANGLAQHPFLGLLAGGFANILGFQGPAGGGAMPWDNSGPLGGRGSGSWNPNAMPGRINNTNPAYESFHQMEVAGVLADPSLTVEDKVTLLIMLIMKKMDKDIERQAQYINSIQQQQSNRNAGGKAGKGAAGGVTGGTAGNATGNFGGNSPSIDVETMKLKRMVDKRSQMFDMLRQIIDKYNQTAKGIIDSIGR